MDRGYARGNGVADGGGGAVFGAEGADSPLEAAKLAPHGLELPVDERPDGAVGVEEEPRPPMRRVASATREPFSRSSGDGVPGYAPEGSLSRWWRCS